MNLILIGPPGAGKGTQARYIQKTYHLNWLASGDLLRAEVKKASPLGQKVAQILASGGLVDNDTMVALIQKAIKMTAHHKQGFILDGFPRTRQQAEQLQSMLNKENTVIDHIIVLNVDDALLIDRISKRFQCRHCGAIYNDDFNPPKKADLCDQCGTYHSFERRKDDKKHVIEKRLQHYHQEVTPMLSFYQKSGIALVEINAMKTIPDVQKHIDTILAN